MTEQQQKVAELGRLSEEVETPQTLHGGTKTRHGGGSFSFPSVYVQIHKPLGRRLSDGFKMLRGEVG